jgi:hypothetical protein
MRSMAGGRRPKPRGRAVSALVVLCLLLSPAISAHLLYQCRMDGVTRATSCCPVERGREAPPARSLHAERRCCDLKVVEGTPAVPGAPPRPAGGGLAVADLHAGSALDGASAIPEGSRLWETRPPPRAPSRDLFLRNSTFLI